MRLLKNTSAVLCLRTLIPSPSEKLINTMTPPPPPRQTRKNGRKVRGTRTTNKAVRGNFCLGGGGGQDYLKYSMGKASEGAKRPSRGRVWEGAVPLSHEGAFAFLRLKLNDLVQTLGGIFGEFSIKKGKKKIHIHGKCVFLTLG